jgi:hypothetical protein
MAKICLKTPSAKLLVQNYEHKQPQVSSSVIYGNRTFAKFQGNDDFEDSRFDTDSILDIVDARVTRHALDVYDSHLTSFPIAQVTFSL